MAVEAMPLFGRYSDAELIGWGRTTDVFRATDSLLGRVVALKVLDQGLSADAGVRARFIGQALAGARLAGSPHIVTIYDVGEAAEQAYVVMEYLPGGSLENRLQEGVQPASRALEWLEQAALALDAAHREGVAHGDVKPANLLLDSQAEVWVSDFGIANALGSGASETRAPLSGSGYLAPEQAQTGQRSAAGDRYALAVVAFELLVGQRPFRGESVIGGPSARPERSLLSVGAVNPALPAGLDGVFAVALAEEPADRYATCAEFVAALRAPFTNPDASTRITDLDSAIPDAATPRRLYRTGRAPKRRRLSPRRVAAVLAAVAIGAGIAGAVISVQSQRRAGSTKGSTHVVTPGRRAFAPPANGPGASLGAAGSAAVSPTRAHALNDQAFALMKHGNYQAALPLLAQAVRGLQGQTTDPYYGYANFNLGRDLIKLGRCGDALPYLEAAKQSEPGRHEVDDAFKFASRCVGGGS